ncbi:LysR family transcriptional regulator [Pollutimonas harenae]|uniref:LysR family transcriptional regulator n=1 Tax=Pollutimonas harenae TaxID=657015 RepID=A0A853H559_9BURK|nr:LysR family transcriptional regulator [Pollutimonas harenae]NYT86315.1 LysR family transcriptional regulator [Pollutimonas harenae]TEA69927.1 LysR family transcriptional regulator [Pollutimonas harenae]
MDKYKEIQVFLAVVENGNFSAAARKLGLTPSSVSKTISRLEARLSVRIFDRIGGSIRLTQEGQVFQLHSQRVIDAMLEAENAVLPEGEQISGLIRVHTSLTFAKYQLAPILSLLLNQYPKLQIEFVIGTSRGNFLERDIDVAIHSGNPTEMSLVGRPLFHRRWAIAASPAYLQRHGMPQCPDDLLHHRCLNFTVRTHWNTWTFMEQGKSHMLTIPDGPVSADQGELLHTLALQGLGIVRLAEFHIGQDIRQGKLLELLKAYEPKTHDTMYVLYPKGRSLAPRIRAFLSFVEKHFSTY